MLSPQQYLGSFQDSIRFFNIFLVKYFCKFFRQWYAIKSQDYISTKYDEYKRESTRRIGLENRLDRLEDLFLIENQKNKTQFLNQLKNASLNVNTQNSQVRLNFFILDLLKNLILLLILKILCYSLLFIN